MTNRWIEHVKRYARKHNISYGCAITEARKTYRPRNKQTIRRMKRTKQDTKSRKKPKLYLKRKRNE